MALVKPRHELYHVVSFFAAAQLCTCDTLGVMAPLGMFKFLVIILFLFTSSEVLAKKSRKKHKNSATKKTTAVSVCKRDLLVEKKSLVENNNFIQAVLVAIETESEKACKKMGQKRADQYHSEGWSCFGPNNEKDFSCSSASAASFAKYKGVRLEHLLFTNLSHHRALIAYLNPHSHENCLTDKSDVEAGGVTDAQCFSH